MDNPIGLGSAVPAISKPKYLVISGLLTKNQPDKMEYTTGDRLDLRGLVVTIFFDYEEPSQDVAFDNFIKWGIRTSPEHGDRLTRLENHSGNVMIYIWSSGLDLESEDDDEEMQAATKLLTVHKGDPVVHWPEGLNVSFFQTLSHIKMDYEYSGANDITGVFSWETPDVPLGEWGKLSCNLIFTPEDSSNYNTVMRNVEVESRFLEMVWINPGTFQMGSPESEEGRPNLSWGEPDDEPLHTVTLTKGFYMGKYEVTREQYAKIMGNDDLLNSPGIGLPVGRMSWVDAIAFCNRLSIKEGLRPVYFLNGDPDINNLDYFVNESLEKLTVSPTANGYRLPTEAEWEYACRAGTTTAYNTGLDYFTDDAGWWMGNSVAEMEVGKLPPNDWGLYDMHGNMAEWCWDVYSENLDIEDQIDPRNDVYTTYGFYTHCRVIRGGDRLNTLIAADPKNLRSARRRGGYEFPSNYPEAGFRVIRY